MTLSQNRLGLNTHHDGAPEFRKPTPPRSHTVPDLRLVLNVTLKVVVEDLSKFYRPFDPAEESQKKTALHPLSWFELFPPFPMVRTVSSRAIALLQRDGFPNLRERV